MNKIFNPSKNLNPMFFPGTEAARQHLRTWRRRGSAAPQSRHFGDMASAAKSGRHWAAGGTGASLLAGATVSSSRRGSDRALQKDADATVALALLRADYARLAAAARASVSAARTGAANPLVYVEAELIRRGGLPPRDATVLTVLADARTAMFMAGEAAGPGEQMLRSDAAQGPRGRASSLVGATGVS
jgi:hypothetical protein